MKYVVSVCFGWVALVSMQIAFAQQCPATVQRPIIKAGDSWSYQRINNWRNVVQERYTETVASVSNQKIDLTRRSKVDSGKTKLIESLDLNPIAGISDYTGHADRWSPNSGIVLFPLSVGKTWTAKARFQTEKLDMAGTYALNAKVIGCDKVKVPAGEFTALKIALQGTYDAEVQGYRGNGTMRLTVWYAPEARNIVKGHYENTNFHGNLSNRDTVEMVKYKLQ